MGWVFVSHVDEDGAVVAELVRDLRAAGFTTWTYHDDCVPGESYLRQTKDGEKLPPVPELEPDSKEEK